MTTTIRQLSFSFHPQWHQKTPKGCLKDEAEKKACRSVATGCDAENGAMEFTHACRTPVVWPNLKQYILGTYQVQTNLSVQTMKTSIWTIKSTSKERGAERWEGGFAKVWLLNPKTGPDCKIIESPMPLGYWYDDADWSFHSLHGEIGLRIIHSLVTLGKESLCWVFLPLHSAIFMPSALFVEC